MSSNIQTCIVLRRADYRDNDRMLTLLSPEQGRVEALVRGCKRPKSPLIAAAELFAFGEYVFYTNAERKTITSCDLTDSFYPLRTDFDRLSHGGYLLELAEAAAQPNEPAKNLFLLLARSLARLAYKQEVPPRDVTCAFLAHYAAILGYKPRLEHCVACGKKIPESEARLLDSENGGIVCAQCATSATRGDTIAPAQVQFLKNILVLGLDKTVYEPSDVPLEQMKKYVSSFLDKPLPAANLVK